MKILEYSGLDTSRVAGTYRKVKEAIARGDFRAAQVKKLVHPGHGKFYRAKLDEADRLIFSLVRYGDEVCALMLEVVLNHDYDASRFLRGAAIDESRIADCELTEALAETEAEARPLRYLHPERGEIHLLDKPISFDDAQEAVYRTPAPLIVVGSAGSGKTALILEKLKHAEGEVLYVTHSAYLARNARDLYYAHGFEHAGQDAVFLSYREFVESIQVPPGREALWRDFAGWFTRQRAAFRDLDGHQAFEEIRGVIAAGSEGTLTREAYRDLGVRQSIFPAERRDQLYDLFAKYREWLDEAGLFDLNLVAHGWLAKAAPRYDFVVIDEVQDITPAQLALVLKTLKRPGHFLLCGDSNQIVHPNFFSWGQIKTLFWRDPALAERQRLSLLAANFRNSQEATRVANQLLKIKHRRFGSIDRESNYLVEAVGGEMGRVELMADKEEAKRELDRASRQSTRFAVLVMRDEDKAAARRHFATPLLFSIHEAKGLEYENIVLYRFVSDHRSEFNEIVAGVAPADLAAETLEYRRARDKGDKSLEVYKFFVNALYVALTRATANLYLIESDADHALFTLLDLTTTGQARVESSKSSLEDWQKEAARLELQGKQEQAEAIRRDILKQAAVPWPVFDPARVTELLVKVFRDQVPGGKLRQQLLEVAACHDEPTLAHWLVDEGNYEPAKNFEKQRVHLGRKHHATYFARHFRDILRDTERYGIDHRLPMNLTPLMAAAAAGNVALVEALLERGANREAADHFGGNALHWALREAFRDAAFARGPFAALYDLLAPASIDVNTGNRLVRIDRHQSEYLLFQTCWTLFKSRFTYVLRRSHAAFETSAILEAWAHLPANVVRPERNKRQHLSAVLSRNEVDRDYAYNRALFKRVAQGWYQFNPACAVRQGGDGEWTSIFQALNLPFIAEFVEVREFLSVWPALEDYLRQAGLPPAATPIAAERAWARVEAARREQLTLIQEEARLREELEALRKARPTASMPAPKPEKDPPWGTPEASKLAIERLLQQIKKKSK